MDIKPSRSPKNRPSGSCESRKSGRRRPTGAASTGSAARPFYKWKAKYGGLEESDAKRLKALEGENAKLKKWLAEAMLQTVSIRCFLPARRSGNPARFMLDI